MDLSFSYKGAAYSQSLPPLSSLPSPSVCSLTVPSSVAAFAFESLDRHFQSLAESAFRGDSRAISQSLSALALRFTTASDGCPYSPDFVNLGIPGVIVAAIDPTRDIADQNCAITIVTFAAAFSDTRYFRGLADAGAVATLLEAKDFRIDDQAPYFEAFGFILRHGRCFFEQIIESVDFDSVFRKLGSPHIGDSDNRTLSFFISKVCDYVLSIQLATLMVFSVQRIISVRGIVGHMWVVLAGLDNQFILNGGRSREAVAEYQSLLRNSGFARGLIEYTIEKWTELKEGALVRVLQLIGHIVERPIDFEFDLPTVLAWIAPERPVCVVVEGLVIAGNLCEAVPGTIEALAGLGFFDVLMELIESGNTVEEIRTEAVVCASTAIVFGDRNLRQGFLTAPFMESLFDVFGTGANHLGHMVVDAAKVLFESAEQIWGSAGALAFFGGAGAHSAAEDAETVAGERTARSIQAFHAVFERAHVEVSA
jgi:hypothetical protein